jgi:hypothetical protein
MQQPVFCWFYDCYGYMIKHNTEAMQTMAAEDRWKSLQPE